MPTAKSSGSPRARSGQRTAAPRAPRVPVLAIAVGAIVVLAIVAIIVSRGSTKTD